MKLYFAGPLFTTAERAWNAEVAAALRAAGHEIFLPQEREAGLDSPGPFPSDEGRLAPAGIFASDKAGIDAADGIVAIMDGPDPDSGTCWEVGYAYGIRMPIVLVRTDIRSTEDIGDYNAMLTQSATIRIDLPAASTAAVIPAILEALERVEAGVSS